MEDERDLSVLLERIKRYKRMGFNIEVAGDGGTLYCYAVQRIKLGVVREEWKPIIEKAVRGESSVGVTHATTTTPGRVVDASLQESVDYYSLPVDARNVLALMEFRGWIKAGRSSCILAGWIAWELAVAVDPYVKIQDKCRFAFAGQGVKAVNTCIATLRLLYEKLREKHSVEELKNTKNRIVEDTAVSYTEILRLREQL